MRLVLIVVILFLLLAILGFAMTNLETRVAVTLWETTYQDVPLWSIVFLSVLLGVVSVGIIAVVDGAFVRVRSRRFAREAERLEGELNWFRTQPVAPRQEPDSPGIHARPRAEAQAQSELDAEPSSAPVYVADSDDASTESDDPYSGGRAV